MDLDNLNFLPQWEDDRFHLDKGEEWKTAGTRVAGKVLYLKWREVFGMIIAFAENLCDDPKDNDSETHEQITKKFIYENAMIVAPKIISATGCGLYVLQMENAAIIRTNCRQLMEQLGFAVLMDFADEQHKQVIEEELNELKPLFKNWVATFQKDEYEDEWGLFN
ncbi:MAG: hypothetical protein M3Z92_03745 [Bacteroidota bacterium]|nr:hypothetical protein [Bacteroidota bacterium]